MQKDYPADWSRDCLSQQLQAIHGNTVAAYVDLRPEFDRLVGISEVFGAVINTSISESDLPCRLFLSRTHAAFLGSASLCLGGMLPESYMVQRGCLEAALYGAHIAKYPDEFKTWIDRNKGGKAKRLVRSKFTISNVMNSLKSVHLDTHRIAQLLYERLLAYGGHPNDMSILTHLELDDGNYSFNSIATGDELRYKNCLQSLTQVGICAIEIFRHCDSRQFNISGLKTRIDQLKPGL